MKRLEVIVDGRLVEATLGDSAPVDGPRHPRWMFRLDGGQVVRGPLTWGGVFDFNVELRAIVQFVRERQGVARQYRERHADFLQLLNAVGMLDAAADALGVDPSDLLPRKR